MRIVVLDGHTLNPGDLTWRGLAELGELEVHDYTPADQAIQRACGAPAVLTNKVVLGEDQMRALPDLRYVGVLATGYNVVDVQAAADRGVVVTNVPTYATEAVAQFVFALLLELCHHVGRHSEGARSGKWARSRDFSYHDSPLVELAGLTMGLVGFGRIGRATGQLARAFGMEVLYHDPTAGACDWAEKAAMDDLLTRSDVVSLHCPLTDATAGLIDAANLARMKPSAFLINPARGPIVDEDALARALNERKLAGAAVDVLACEPPREDNPLLAAANCIVTPHIAWATRSARQRLMHTAVENVRAWQAGQSQNVVTP